MRKRLAVCFWLSAQGRQQEDQCAFDDCTCSCCAKTKSTLGRASIGASCNQVSRHDPSETCRSFLPLAKNDDDDDVTTTKQTSSATRVQALYVTFNGHDAMTSATNMCKCIAECGKHPPTAAPTYSPIPLPTQSPTHAPTTRPTHSEGHECLKNACEDLIVPLKVPCVDWYTTLVHNPQHAKYHADPCQYYVTAQESSVRGRDFDDLTGIFKNGLEPALRLCRAYSLCMERPNEVFKLARQHGLSIANFPTLRPTMPPTHSQKAKETEMYNEIKRFEQKHKLQQIKRAKDTLFERQIFSLEREKGLVPRKPTPPPPTGSPTGVPSTHMTMHPVFQQGSTLLNVLHFMHPDGTAAPTAAPSHTPSPAPTTRAPTPYPSGAPTWPTWQPTRRPTKALPTSAPTRTPSASPSSSPTVSDSPTAIPTPSPSAPTPSPSASPSASPTHTHMPTWAPTHTPFGLSAGAVIVRAGAVCRNPSNGRAMHGNLLGANVDLAQCSQLCRESMWCRHFYFSGFSQHEKAPPSFFKIHTNQAVTTGRGKCKRVDGKLFAATFYKKNSPECKTFAPSNKFNVYRLAAFPEAIHENEACTTGGKESPSTRLSSEKVDMRGCFDRCLMKPDCKYFYFQHQRTTSSSSKATQQQVLGDCSMISTKHAAYCSPKPKQGNFVFKVEGAAGSIGS